jgi:hypothetical protein
MKKIFMKIIKSSNTALKEGDEISATFAFNKPTKVRVIGGPKRKRHPRNSKEPTTKEMLKLILARLDEHDRKFDEITRILQRHEEILMRHEEILLRHEEILLRHETILKRHEDILLRHEEILMRHEEILLRHDGIFKRNNLK